MDKKNQKIIDDLNKKLEPNCEHDFNLVGFWDGYKMVDGKKVFTGGTTYKCIKCNGVKHG